MRDAPATHAPVLEMRDIRKRFPGVVALDGVDLCLLGGEVHVLVGENGAGKSTLMKVLSGACQPDAGEVVFAGRPVRFDGPAAALALGIRVIHQELSLHANLSVAENLFLGHLPTRRFGLVDWRRLDGAASERLGELGLTIDPRTRLGRLSLAERQMVEIARALVPSPSGSDASVLVMDEPTSALSAREADRLFFTIDRLAARGVAIVYITHRLSEVHRVGGRVTVLRDGRRVCTQQLANTTVDDLVRLMANREVGDHYPRRRPATTAADDELLRVEHASRHGVLHDISFTLRGGEVLGLGGLAGAGRSELARAIAGIDPLDAGRVVVRGAAVTLRAPRDAIRLGIGLMPEDRKADGLVGGLTVTRNIALPHGRRVARAGVVSARTEAALAGPIAADLRVKATPTQPVRLLSGGNQQKVVLGKWLAGEARIFIFDEPTRGVDVGAKIELYHLMNRLTDDGAGILMISSELPELLGMSDRVLVMCRGRLAAELDRAEATEARVLAAAFGMAGPS